MVNSENLDLKLVPTTLVILGATGDLAVGYLFSALWGLFCKKLLPEDFRVVAVGRREMSDEEYRVWLKSVLDLRLGKDVSGDFLQKIIYSAVDFENLESFKALSGRLDFPKEHALEDCHNRLFYFATLPVLFETLSVNLKESGLLQVCALHGREARVLIEKPFGNNLASSRSLNKTLLKFFSERQIFRIDHYLGKETVQNIFTVRFANDLFEPIWNHKYIDHVEISNLESEGVLHRLDFYEKTGALKDFLQNHLLNILALVAMERPLSLNSETVRDSKVRVLKSIQPFKENNLKDIVKAQYANGLNTLGYVAESGGGGKAETFVALKLFLKTPRWKGVPFYLKTGKRLSSKVTEVSVHFKKDKQVLFIPSNRASNVLVFRVQPSESVSLLVNNKVPGFGLNLHQARLNFVYEDFKNEIPSAYERLLLDFYQSDPSLFIRSDEIDCAWKFIESIYRFWDRIEMDSYLPFSEGPKSAIEIMARDGRQWYTK